MAISVDSPVQEAMIAMREGGFRHLPVLKDGKPFSIITEKEIAMVLAFSDDHNKILERSVEDFCALDLIYVDINASLNEILEKFISKKIGAMLVLEESKLVGIVSVIDILKAFRSII